MEEGAKLTTRTRMRVVRSGLLGCFESQADLRAIDFRAALLLLLVVIGLLVLLIRALIFCVRHDDAFSDFLDQRPASSAFLALAWIIATFQLLWR